MKESKENKIKWKNIKNNRENRGSDVRAVIKPHELVTALMCLPAGDAPEVRGCSISLQARYSSRPPVRYTCLFCVFFVFSLSFLFIYLLLIFYCFFACFLHFFPFVFSWFSSYLSWFVFFIFLFLFLGFQ